MDGPIGDGTKKPCGRNCRMVLEINTGSKELPAKFNAKEQILSIVVEIIFSTKLEIGG